MRRGDEVELDITRAASRGPHDGWADDASRGEPGDGAMGDDDAGRDGRAGRERRRWNHPLPWVAVGVGLAVVGSVLATNVPPPLPDGAALVADQSREPVFQWEAQTCEWDAEPTVADDLVLVTGPNCAQALDTRTGEERWRIREPRLTCRATATADIVACLQGTEERHLITFDVATGERTEHATDVDGVADLVPVGPDVVTSTAIDEGVELRRTTLDGRVLWSAVLASTDGAVPPEPGRINTFGAMINVSGTSGTVLSADGTQIQTLAFDGLQRIVAETPDGVVAIYGPDGTAERTVVEGELLPYVSDEPDPGVRFVSEPPVPMGSPPARVLVQDRAGRVMWEVPEGSVPAVVVDGVIILLPLSSSEHLGFIALDVRTGEQRWSSQGDVPFSMRSWTDGRHLLIGQLGQTRQDLSAIDVHTGEELWEVHLRDSESGGLVDVARDGTLILRTEDGLAGWHSP